MLLMKFVHKRTKPEWLSSKPFYIGLAFMAIALFFFVRGLDDDNDYLRFNHGLWHLFVGISFYFLYNVKALKKHTI
jgi:predicted membrane channel-forming protein YqfA (hemolysin III family)